ncbi:MAG: DNA repair protein RadA, partial [Thiotrichales bacterium]
MSKNKIAHLCSGCGSQFSKWQGKCTECGAWNAINEIALATTRKAIGYSGSTENEAQLLDNIDLQHTQRFSSGIEEIDRVLGGGLVVGSVVLLGGDPGIGKSSILLQIASHLSTSCAVLYVSGEESNSQIAMRVKRLQLKYDKFYILPETDVENICLAAQKLKPKLIVIDSIQTMQIADIPAAAGGVTQVRESAAVLTRFAKQNACTVFMVGHVTKSGEVAGPRVLEHIVDAVIFLEGQHGSRLRIVRTMKNRFGAANEIGVFAMTDKGMLPVKNPSAIFLSRVANIGPGTVVTAIWEGTRPLLVELQALVDNNQYGNPRRVTLGFEQNRLVIL